MWPLLTTANPPPCLCHPLPQIIISISSVQSYQEGVAAVSESAGVSVASFLRLNLPLAMILPSAGLAFHAVKMYPSVPPRSVMRGCVRPGKTCQRRARLVCIDAPSRSIGLSGKSGLPSQRSSSSADLPTSSGTLPLCQAVRRLTVKRSASSASGSR